MRSVRPSNPRLEGLEPYDPKYLPAQALLSANENPLDVPVEVRRAIEQALAGLPFNRYPDPMANELRDAIAAHEGLARENVLVGNGGDELLFDLALAWGGEWRSALVAPPTFSVYAANAHITGTAVVEVPRRADMSLDEDAIVARASEGDIGYVIVCSPNNPTGDLASAKFVARLLEATDALVLIDEAYHEFSRKTVAPLLAQHVNLAVLRTFSKAYSLAGVRVGYLLSSPQVIGELAKVRQPYSVDAVSQEIALQVCRHRDAFEPGIHDLIMERKRMAERLEALSGVEAWPSSANFILFRVAGVDGAQVWQRLYDAGILVRDFSANPATPGCLRVSVGTPEQNDAFLACLAQLCNVD